MKRKRWQGNGIVGTSALTKKTPGSGAIGLSSGEILIDLIVDATPWWDDNDPEFQHRERTEEPEVREEVHPRLADEAKTAQFLASQGEVLTPAAMELFLDCVPRLRPMTAGECRQVFNRRRRFSVSLG